MPFLVDGRLPVALQSHQFALDADGQRVCQACGLTLGKPESGPRGPVRLATVPFCRPKKD